MWKVTGEPPTVSGDKAPKSGYSSASIISVSPKRSSAWPIRPSEGSVMRKTSVAPKASL
jgi:hypothetical protein